LSQNTRQWKKVLYLLPIVLAPLATSCSPDPKPLRRIGVVMKKYAIEPGVIRVKQGETVQFELITSDVQHGFDVPELGISESVQPGRPASFQFTAARKGSFDIECGIICGSGHENMRAQLIVD
jgi:cytochrome c oxidase subunit II